MLPNTLVPLATQHVPIAKPVSYSLRALTFCVPWAQTQARGQCLETNVFCWKGILTDKHTEPWHSPQSASMALESRATFAQRAKDINIAQEDLDRLVRGGTATYAEFAFCCAYTPGSSDEKPLFDHLESILGARPTGAQAANLRRLFFESHSHCLQDLKARLERSDSSEAKILPLAEKMQRIADLKTRLPSVMLTPALEPSHSLVDKAVHQWEEGCVHYLELHKCTSREQEAQATKSSHQLTFDATGNIKVTKQQQLTECSVHGETLLRSAFIRRSLAYDLAGIATFHVQEHWSQTLFERMQKEPPTGYKHVSVEQILQADKALWLKVSEHTRSKLSAVVNGKKAVDAAIHLFSQHPDVMFFVLPLPLPSPSRPGPYDWWTTGGKGKDGKSKGDWKGGSNKGDNGKGEPKGAYKGKIVVPDDCVIKTPDNKPICMKFNVNACKAKIKPGKRCQHGYHLCWKRGCHQPKLYGECTHSPSA